VVRSAGFEPAALGFEARCSIQLSYERGAGTIADFQARRAVKIFRPGGP
jgi:hypothetical protein